MGVTVIGRLGTATPAVVHAPIVYTKSTFSGLWQLDPTISAVAMSVRSSGQGLGTCELRRRFGNVKEPHEPATALLTTRTPLNLQGSWVRVAFIGPHGEEPAWIGRISSERRTVFSGGNTVAEAGVQTWVAHEPLQELRKINVARSFWLQQINGSPTVRDLAWLPPMNARDRQTGLVGNRSAFADDASETYMYGGTDVWTNYQYLAYLLTHFVDDSAVTGGPQWWIGGQADLLENISATLDFGNTASVASIIRKLIPISMGIDYTIVEIPESPSPGFEIQVYALTDDARTFRGVTIPLNPNTVVIDPSEFPEAVSVDIVRTLDQQYDRINVIGARIVVCCTLEARFDELVPKWTEDQEDAYKAGDTTGADEAERHDGARKRDELRAVYQRFGAPDQWDFLSTSVAIEMTTDALFTFGGADYQHTVRRTLPYLPLREGFDYTGKTIVDNNKLGQEGDLLGTQAWVYDQEENRYQPCETVGISVSASQYDYGVLLGASPNHLLAANNFDGAKDTLTEPKYDPDRLVATIAFESDHRLAMHFDLVRSGDGTKGATINIEVPDAELWYVASGTVVGISEDGTLQRTSLANRSVRDDSPRLALVMAGALARYHNDRARATITIRGLWPWPFLLGSILTVVKQGSDVQTIRAAITEIEWRPGVGDRPEPVTIIRTGFAR